jgi:hypothetical protein
VYSPIPFLKRNNLNLEFLPLLATFSYFVVQLRWSIHPKVRFFHLFIILIFLGVFYFLFGVLVFYLYSGVALAHHYTRSRSVLL